MVWAPLATVEDAEARPYTPNGDLISHLITDNLLIPGAMILLETFLENGPGRAASHGMQFLPYGTRSIVGGEITAAFGNGYYGVNVFGMTASAVSPDATTFSAGDWVFLVNNCCQKEIDPQTGDERFIDCGGHCDGDAEVENPGLPNEQYTAAYSNEQLAAWIAGVQEFLILPVTVSGCGDAPRTIADFGREALRNLASACIIRGTIIQLSADEADIEVDGSGRVNGVPIRYLLPGAEGYEGGGAAFVADDTALILNRTGNPAPTAGELVVFGRCAHRHQYVVIMAGGHGTYDPDRQQVIVWDLESNRMAQNIPNGSGGVITFPCTRSEILDWWHQGEIKGSGPDGWLPGGNIWESSEAGDIHAFGGLDTSEEPSSDGGDLVCVRTGDIIGSWSYVHQHTRDPYYNQVDFAVQSSRTSFIDDHQGLYVLGPIFPPGMVNDASWATPFQWAHINGGRYYAHPGQSGSGRVLRRFGGPGDP